MRRRILFLLLPLVLLSRGSVHSQDTGWTQLTPFESPGGAIVTDPRRPDRIISFSYGVSAQQVVLRTFDAGRTWRTLNPGDSTVSGLGIDAVAPFRLYASGSGGVLRSDDDGRTWRPINAGIVGSIVGTIWVHPSRGDFLYAAAVLFSPGTAYLWHTDDGGDHWHSGVGYFPWLAISSSDPDVVYASGGGKIFKSRDRLETYFDVSSGLPPASPPLYVSYLVVAPGDSSVVYASGFDDGSIYRTTDGGATWIPTAPPPLGPGPIAIDQRDSGRILVGGRGGVSRSSDGGDTWTTVTRLGSEQVLNVAFDPGETDAILASTSSGLFRQSFAAPGCAAEAVAL
jgi:photosystem II stability/assembly factor-like uncharacterized protein